jgi:putative oxygen-independent coproporphyrinogen III oxidase
MENNGLYIHIPFCKTKCPYCDFYSVTELSLIDPWLDALKKEADFYKGEYDVFDSLYLGGGTPSLFGNQQMEDLMNAVLTNVMLARDTEITIEANPDDITADKLEFWRSLGVNRISIGVQSFDDEELLFLKRRHNASVAERAVDLVNASGFKNYGIDLMYGLPGQTKDSWMKTLEHALTFRPTHLSCYQFTLEERTPYGQLWAEGKLRLAGECEEKAFFLLTSSFLKARGFIHYEVSNFAEARKYESRHNLKYWQHIPYLGLGPAAHSFKAGMRRWNHRSVEKYCEALSRGEKPVEDAETLSPEQLRLERLFLGFRTDCGVAVSDLSGKPSFDETLLRLRKSRLVKIHNERIIPTRKGYLIADHLPLMFF